MKKKDKKQKSAFYAIDDDALKKFDRITKEKEEKET